MNITIEQEKWLALQQEINDLKWFEIDGEFFEGNEEKLFEEYEEYFYEKEMLHNGESPLNFTEWLIDKGLSIELGYYDEFDSNLDYKVYTDSEADEAFDDYLNNYLDEIVYSEIPKYLHSYFDEDKWKFDCKLGGERAGSLAGYDGKERVQTVNNTDYYIYRIN